MKKKNLKNKYLLLVFLLLFFPFAPRDHCNFQNIQESELNILLLTDPEQNHTSLTCNPLLMEVAEDKAVDMFQRDYFSHITPEGFGPNYLVLQVDFPLPEFYDHSLSGNNIESIALGHTEASQTWGDWKNSPEHRKHVLGETDFFQSQDKYGIGYHEGYWVILISE